MADFNVYFKTGESKLGEMVCHWDDRPAMKMIQGWLEEVFRDFQKELERVGIAEWSDETALQKELNALMLRGDDLFAEYGMQVFSQAQARVVSAVMLKLAEGIPRRVQELFGDVLLEMVDREMQGFKENREELSKLFKIRHNEMVGIRRGRQAQATAEEIIECLKSLPKRRRTLAWLSSELDLSVRTIQHTLEAAGTTFRKEKEKANAQE